MAALDIITSPQIPLSATSDQPVLDAPRPPESASNDATDQQAGTPKEITAAELAVAEAQRKGVLETPADDAEGETSAKPRAMKKVDADDPLIADLPANSPDWYRREVASIRRTERAKTEAAFAAAKAEVGDAAWDAALEATRDKVVAAAKAESAKALKEAREARDAIAAREAELTELRAKVPTVEEPKPTEDPRPARHDFDDPDVYDDAVVEWGKREGVRAAEQQAAERKAAEDATERQRLADEAKVQNDAEVLRINEAWATKKEAAIEKYPDYVDVAEASPDDGGPLITEIMAAAIVQADNGTDVAYYLGNNPEESARIANIKNIPLQLFELGRIAERLAAPQRRAAPRPKPIEPVDTSRSVDQSDEEPDMESYAKQRNSALARERRPFFPAGQIH